MTLVVEGWLDHMILEVFYNLNDSMILRGEIRNEYSEIIS